MSSNCQLSPTEINELVTYHGGVAAVQSLLQVQKQQFQAIELTIGDTAHLSTSALCQTIQKNGFTLSEDILQSLYIKHLQLKQLQPGMVIKLVLTTPRALGLGNGGTISDIFIAAAERNFILCHEEIGLHLLLQHKKGWINEAHIVIATEAVQIWSFLYLFIVNSQALWTVQDTTGYHWQPDQKFLFQRL